MTLRGQVAIVTGGARGIGLKIGRRLHQEGASVIFADRESSEAVLRYVDEAVLRERVVFHQADISRLREIEELVSRAMVEFGRLDILVNNAGIDPPASFLEIGEDDWHRILDTNLKGAFFCAQRAAARMQARKHGRIVNISSVHGQATMPGYTVYATSKSGINGMTRALALELAPHGITVNAIAAGAIEVERFVSHPLYDSGALAKEIPLSRVGKGEDIAGVAAFLCSSDAAWLTGEVITVDGGTLTRLYLYAGRPVPS